MDHIIYVKKLKHIDQDHCFKDSYRKDSFLRFPSSDGMLPVKLHPDRILKLPVF